MVRYLVKRAKIAPNHSPVPVDRKTKPYIRSLTSALRELPAGI